MPAKQKPLIFIAFARPKNFQHFTNFFSKDDDQTHLSTSCEALSEMAEKMLSKVLWGPTSSAFEKCVTEVALVTFLGLGLSRPWAPGKAGPSMCGNIGTGRKVKEKVKRKLAKSG